MNINKRVVKHPYRTFGIISTFLVILGIFIGILIYRENKKQQELYLESELKSLIIEYTEFLEFIICVKHELKYVITVAYSNTNGYRATKEQISEAFSKFSNIKKLLLGQGDPYDI